MSKGILRDKINPRLKFSLSQVTPKPVARAGFYGKVVTASVVDERGITRVRGRELFETNPAKLRPARINLRRRTLPPEAPVVVPIEAYAEMVGRLDNPSPFTDFYLQMKEESERMLSNASPASE